MIQREAGSYSATARTCGSFPALLEGRLRAQHSVLHLTAYDILVQHFLLTRRPPASSLHRWRCRKCRVVGVHPPEKKKTPLCFTTRHRVAGPAVKISNSHGNFGIGIWGLRAILWSELTSSQFRSIFSCLNVEPTGIRCLTDSFVA